jgi:EAL domain-containing protein (putative c-di-GMP-specific phosphodiesterase class I)
VMGCDLGQGALLAPPLPKERFLDALRQHSNKSRGANHAPQEGSERVA